MWGKPYSELTDDQRYDLLAYSDVRDCEEGRMAAEHAQASGMLMLKAMAGRK